MTLLSQEKTNCEVCYAGHVEFIVARENRDDPGYHDLWSITVYGKTTGSH